MNKSTYLENIVLHLFNINTWTWVSASSTVKGTEAVSRRSDKARVNTKMFLIIININRDILRKYSRKDTSSFGHWSVTPNPSPSTSHEVFFWYLDIFDILIKRITEYYRVWQSVTKCYSVLQSVTECYRVLQSVTGCYRVLQGVTGCYRVLQSKTKYYNVLQRHI